ncbi:hypothetical protein SARC_04188 [Sphaeroforma arctica JP610]|uniref:Importin subunit alpha n=1 Tax=Sphaeroforma arctica JP610 TaxID=667725 RepID=A0A0L0G401_9EUKA|nr:hypothetical protein SARC_04188 [Sphaeroforma arctica JP610]KNC83564.1 hypothetical protein SARC_04188 [Sphaeroforma arctica JP610]|eukprot:XP_014157466.1 hypothetical protein SARC_04188 [Sphaeroforma arctica JP610]
MLHCQGMRAIWCHVNISASKSLHTKAVLQNTPALIPFLENASEKHQDLSAWALGNIAGDSAEARDTIIAQGAHHPLIRMVTNHTLASTTVSPTATSIGEAAYFCLSNLCRGQGARPELFANDAVLASTLQILNVHIPVALAGSDPPLVQNPELARPMLLSPETITTRASVGIASEALWFLTYMTANNESLCERLCKDGLMSLLTSAMQATTEIATPMVSPALRTLGNILAGEDAFTELALQQANLFNGLGQCVTSPERSLRLEALWALSNIVAGKPEFATAVVDEGLFPYIVRIIEYDALQDPEMVTQAMYVINNTAHHGEAMCRFIYHKTDVLRQSLKVLRAGEGQSCKLVLQFLEMMLQSHAQVSWKVEEEGGVECLEMFEYHDNEELQRISSFLIDKYFYSNEEEPI